MNGTLENDINEKLSEIGLNVRELYGGNIFFTAKITGIGTYLFSDKKGNHIKTVEIREVNDKIYSSSRYEEYINYIIWNGLAGYIYKQNGSRPDSKKIALEHLKIISEEYYNEIKNSTL